MEYARKDAKGKTIVIPKEKIVEELYHQRISFSFEKTKSKIQNYEKSTKEDTDEFLQKEIQSMIEQVADDFYNACLHTYMNKYYSTILKIQDYQHEQEQKEYSIPSEPPTELESKLEKAQQEIKTEIYQKLMAAAKSVNTSVQSESILKQYLERELKKQQNYIEDKIHRFEISAALDALDSENIQYYQVVCESKYEACDTCKSLHRKKQPVSEAKEGVNLPPLHPNCRCTIGSYIESSGKKENISLFETIGTILKDPNLLLKNLNTPSSLLLAVLPHYLLLKLRFPFMPNVLKFTGFKELATAGNTIDYLITYDKKHEVLHNATASKKEPIQIEKDCYYFHPEYLQNPLLIDGEIVHPSNLSDLDRQILDVMKKRDTSTSQEEIEELSQQLYTLAAGSSTDLDISKSYAYYEMGRDTTDEILELMEGTEKKYAEQKKRGWIINLPLFYSVVQNNGELDLKNLSAYKTNATYIFDGEIVDRDALGNITYGYFGRYLGIPTTVLLFGGGYAQYQAGTSDLKFFFSYGDDPRDQYRIMQGILLYDRIHKKE